MKSRAAGLMFLLIATLLVFTACSGSKSEAEVEATLDATMETTLEASIEDLSIRAIGKHAEGRLIVKPASYASEAPLGAPSCYGQEMDLRWIGDYEAIWESKADGTVNEVLHFPSDFEIIQQDDAQIEMQSFKIKDTEIFAYVPRYTDCHALETYLFGISGGEAFPIPFEMESKRVWNRLDQHPIRPLQVTDDELILTGGYGAGQDYINVYHFRYDTVKRSMILYSTDQVKPNEFDSLD